MRSWNKQTVELSLTVRETERLLEWLDLICLDRSKDRSGFQLAYTLRTAIDGPRPSSPEA